MSETLKKADEISRRALLPLMALAACASPLGANAQARGDINVRSVGDGERTWVLIHPFGGSGRFWGARAATLAGERGVRVLSPDLPSHGQSAIVPRFNYDAAAHAIAEALEPRLESVAIVVGASSGATVALKLAARWRKPVAAIGGWRAFSAVNTERMRAQSRGLPPETAQFVETFLEQGAPQRDAIQRHYGDLADYGQAPLLTGEEIAAIGGRALLINGGADRSFTRESAHALADAIPGSVLAFVTGADHLEPLAAAHSRFTWAQIAAFLEAHSA